MAGRRRKLFRAVVAAAVVVVATGLISAPAYGATTGSARVMTDTKVEYNAGVGRVNDVTVTRSGRTVTIDDRVTIRPGKGCKRAGTDVTRVRCTTPKQPTWIRVLLRDRDDHLINGTDLGMSGHGEAGADTIDGGPRGDYLYGGTGADRLTGNGGADNIDGHGGDDLLDGGPGDDSLDGDVGGDTILGRTGHDNIFGGRGDDRIWAGAGPDTVWEFSEDAGSDADFISGGSGANDAVYYVGRERAVFLDADGVTGDDGAKGERDSLQADIEVLSGGDGDDRLVGTPGGDTLYGQGGNDTLIGGGGDDALLGESGTDRFDGGANGPDGDYCDVLRGEIAQGCERL